MSALRGPRRACIKRNNIIPNSINYDIIYIYIQVSNLVNTKQVLLYYYVHSAHSRIDFNVRKIKILTNYKAINYHSTYYYYRLQAVTRPHSDAVFVLPAVIRLKVNDGENAQAGRTVSRVSHNLFMSIKLLTQLDQLLVLLLLYLLMIILGIINQAVQLHCRTYHRIRVPHTLERIKSGNARVTMIIVIFKLHLFCADDLDEPFKA